MRRLKWYDYIVVFVMIIFGAVIAGYNLYLQKRMDDTEIYTSQMTGTVLEKHYDRRRVNKGTRYYPVFLMELESGDEVQAEIMTKEHHLFDDDGLLDFANKAKEGDQYIVDKVSHVLYGEEIEANYIIYVENQNTENAEDKN